MSSILETLTQALERQPAGQFEAATVCIAEAIRITPRIAPFHNNLGTVLEARGEQHRQAP